MKAPQNGGGQTPKNWTNMKPAEQWVLTLADRSHSWLPSGNVKMCTLVFVQIFMLMCMLVINHMHVDERKKQHKPGSVSCVDLPAACSRYSAGQTTTVQQSRLIRVHVIILYSEMNS